MKIKLIFLNIFIHIIFAFIFPYIPFFIIYSIYFTAILIGYFSTPPDMIGEVGISAVFSLFSTLLMLLFIFLILVPGNRFIYRRLHISKLNYWIFSLSVFIIAFFVILLNFDPFDFIEKFTELKQN
ncbi:hypothetical protein CON64_22425 [Bacillus pseudomycoides]|nr:hypothetical protein CON64_22425 [Bacillus pseudomycoides]